MQNFQRVWIVLLILEWKTLIDSNEFEILNFIFIKNKMDEFDDFNYDDDDEISSGDSEDSSSEESDYDNDCEYDEDEEQQTDQHVKFEQEDKYIGMPFLTKFEKCRVIGIRIEQIIAGSKIFIETNLTDPYEIAIEELRQKKIPLIIRRYINGKYIDISVNQLISDLT